MLLALLVVSAQITAADRPIATLERTLCFGECPAYKLSVFKDGRVEWEGKAHVKVEGKKSKKLEPAKLEALKAAFKEAKYLETAFQACAAHDVPFINLSYAEGKKKQETSHFSGTRCGSYEVLGPLTRKFEALVGLDEWLGVEPIPDGG